MAKTRHVEVGRVTVGGSRAVGARGRVRRATGARLDPTPHLLAVALEADVVGVARPPPGPLDPSQVEGFRQDRVDRQPPPLAGGEGASIPGGAGSSPGVTDVPRP